MRRREFYKFLCGFLAGAAVVHANMGFSIAMGIFNEPHYLGRAWGAGSLWIGAGVYLLASLAVGYLAWGKRTGDRSGNSAVGQKGRN